MTEPRDRPGPQPEAGLPDPGPAVEGETAPRPVPEADVFVFRTVRQSGGGRRLPWGSAHLTLVFNERGIEISGSRRGERTVVPWASVIRVSRGVSGVGPDGGSVTVIGIESPGRIMRFVVTSHRRDPIQLAALSEQIQRWSDWAGSTPPASGSAPTPGPGPSPPGPSASIPAAWPEHPPAGGTPEPGRHGTPPPTLMAPMTPPAPMAPPIPAPVAPITPPAPMAPPTPAPMAPMTPLGLGVPGRPFRPGPGRHRRARRIITLLVAVAFLASGTGLAIALSSSGPPSSTSGPTTTPPTADQALAERLMLTRGDLPAGWKASSGTAGGANSPRVQSGESEITTTFAGCMGISRSQASLALGGGAADQTAQTTSPVFVAPGSTDPVGAALELQTAASIVRNHQDELSDFSLFADPRYPQCAGTAVASETQLGADSSSGTNARPGPASVSAVDLPAPAGEQLSGLVVAFTVSDRSASVPVEVETVFLGHDRIEANLQALAIGAQIPAGVLTSSLSAFEQRVATGGRSTEV